MVDASKSASAPKGAADGGVLTQITNDIKVECSVASIPEEIRVMVGELGLNESLHLSDIKLPEGVTLLDDPETILCQCTEVAEEVEPEEGAEGETAEPEVIGAKKEEDEEGAE